jgi:hypothetical protein
MRSTDTVNLTTPGDQEIAIKRVFRSWTALSKPELLRLPTE